MIDTDFDAKKEMVLDAIFDVLIEKNKRYGNSALKPLNIFYKGDATTSIAIRLDDKISRIKNSEELRKNDMFDILGYLILYSISRDIYFDKSDDWEDNITKLHRLINDDSLFNMEDKQDNIFLKNRSVLYNIEEIISSIKMNSNVPDGEFVRGLIVSFVKYFIENDITDFNELID